MVFLKKLFGKTPQEHEKQGDTLFRAGRWGHAKIEYDRALDKAQKAELPEGQVIRRLEDKIRLAKRSLALEHQQNADDLIDGGYYQDARELVSLALELSEDPGLINELEQTLKDIERLLDKEALTAHPFYGHELEKVETEAPQGDGDEEFNALCGTLPEEVQASYRRYGENFKHGYLALNQGDFEMAADYLSRAMDENPSPGNYIALELATAYLNLGNTDRAQGLLVLFLDKHPEALPGYRLLCEIYWENRAFDRAHALLDKVPRDLAASVAVTILRGETLYHAGKHQEAKAFYRAFFRTYGFNQAVARVLAKTLETLGELTDARQIYGEIMGNCTSCGARIDPSIKQRYADLSYESGITSMEILELYLSLAREIPDKAADYYEKISRIYAIQGNEQEAGRFRAFSQKVKGFEDPRN